MTITTSAPARAAGTRVGYAAAAVVNAIMLYAVNVWPGWQVLPFLTDETPQVLGWVNASLVLGVVANLVYLARDPVWLKSLGDVVTTGFGLVVLVRIWQIFPFEFDTGFDWSPIFRVLLVLAMVGSAIGMVVGVVRFARAVAT